MNYKNLFLILISGLLLTGCGTPKKVVDYDCLINAGESCITKISKTVPFEGNYWKGAVNICGGVENMPRATDLARIATFIYDDLPVLPADEDRKKLKNNDNYKLFDLYKTQDFYIFSEETEQAKKYAYVRFYYPRQTEWNSVANEVASNGITVCVKH